MAQSVTTELELYPYDREGVDVSLIRWMLSLTPAERVQVLQNSVNQIEQIREYLSRGLPPNLPDTTSSQG